MIDLAKKLWGLLRGSNPDTYWAMWALIISFELWVLNYWVGMYLSLFDKEGVTHGTFGDMFGAANSIFSAFAVIGVAYSVAMQRKELSLTREDRDDTRSILKDQQDNLKRQRFETTFFNLFAAFNAIADAMDISYARPKYDTTKELMELTDEQVLSLVPDTKVVVSAKGRGAFEELLIRLGMFFRSHETNSMKRDLGDSTGDGFEDALRPPTDIYQRAYRAFFKEQGDEVGRYFRSLYTILNFIDTGLNPDKDADEEKIQEIEEQKKFYFKLLRAQLSQHESTFLALNYVSPFTTDKFNDLVVEYGMAKNADRNNALLERMRGELPDGMFGQTYLRSLRVDSNSPPGLLTDPEDL